MKIASESPVNLTIKLRQYDKMSRELNKLKFHLRVKRNLYERTQYQNITNRVKSCQDYLKQQKSKVVREQAGKLISQKKTVRNPKISSPHNRQSKLFAIQAYNRKINTEMRQTRNNFTVNLETQQKSLSQSKFMISYQLSPIGKNTRTKNLKTQKVNNQRYISEFQLKIKEKLAKISLKDYKGVQMFDGSLFKKQTNSPQKPLIHTKVSNTHSLKLQQPLAKYNNQRQYNGNANEVKSIRPKESPIHQQRYQSLEQRINRCKTQLKEMHQGEIIKVKQQNISLDKKNFILNNFYQKYKRRRREGDQSALDLMCLATLARADILLQQI